ncbi:hypothetical protein SISSUDRAFT_1129536 [Sistotremastrum suecicum HHB10207 ss-3]|uniref:F-box domain-containing protein n=1 Tax=Sistotremastrum suecicum HHB10207 ss-3 TaxID=1314776 RepID=A0A166CJ05_9AGAM|nr:hypothetical protein SISSUDRAFT_1129536 [Sistotremastrum suecicum HHB10207 ss-3]
MPPVTRSHKSRIPKAPDPEPTLPETLDGQKSKLPPELLRNIVEEVALSIPDAKSRNHALYILLLTSRDLHREARRILYRDITFVNKTPVAGQIANALHAGAAKYVRSLRVQHFDLQKGRRNNAKTHFYHLPLNRMNGLQSLELWGKWMSDASAIADFLITSIPVNSLLKFQVVLPMSNPLLRFLQQQNRIQFLSVQSLQINLTTASLSSRQLMPNLKRIKLLITSDNDGFQELIEERPITVFHLGSLLGLPTCWSTFAPRLQALDVSTSIVGVPKFQEFIEIFSTTAVNLRVLACFKVVSWSGALPRTMPAGYSALSNLRHLEALSVSFDAASNGQLNVMTIPDVVGPPTQLKSIFVTQRANQVIADELLRDSESGWTSVQREGMMKEDWFEIHLRKLGLAYGDE